MITIIAGSRSITSPFIINAAMALVPWEISEVVSGCADGPDTLGEWWACDNLINIKRFPVSQADWDQYGKSAGPRRNEQMAKYADALVAIHDGVSKGTQHMIRTAHQHGLEVIVFLVENQKVRVTDRQPTTKASIDTR